MSRNEEHSATPADELKALVGQRPAIIASSAHASVARFEGTGSVLLHRAANDLLLIPIDPCVLTVSVGAGAPQRMQACPYTAFILRAGNRIGIDYDDCRRIIALAIDPAWFNDIAARCEPGTDNAQLRTLLHPDMPPIVNALRRHLSFPQSAHDRFIALNAELIVSYCFWYGSPARTSHPPKAGLLTKSLQRVLRQVEDNIDARIPITELAGSVGMSPSKFSRHFKAVLGLSPQAYIIERRVLKVQDLLEDTGSTLAEVALDAGFSSQAHMTSSFTRHFGITPGEYRKHFLSQMNA
ncbi:AraC family transcriptional regulator [Sulfitobacter sp. S190]|uniref:AraC family transcriptional regulator n=1 Tax=Sulfitobacter sp. S190 TaxID=2867022 RepID=UPI0021A2DDEB|nr:AraC family transcriptional regulator [Sulfitobacter sp. S190]UWR24525.1 AraC family transcriptional regulator [Sulfitobacter sp. S190]